MIEKIKVSLLHESFSNTAMEDMKIQCIPFPLFHFILSFKSTLNLFFICKITYVIVLVIVRAISASVNSISTQEEVYASWEPIHYLIYGSGNHFLLL